MEIIVLFNHLFLNLYNENELEITDSFLMLYSKSNLIGMLERYNYYNYFLVKVKFQIL